MSIPYNWIPSFREMYQNLMLPFTSGDVNIVAFSFWYLVPGIIIIFLNLFLPVNSRKEKIAEFLIVILASLTYYESYWLLDLIEQWSR